MIIVMRDDRAPSRSARLATAALNRIDTTSHLDEWLAAGDDRETLRRLAVERRKADSPEPPRLLSRWWRIENLAITDGWVHLMTPTDGPSDRVLFHLHGGGYVTGPSTLDWLAMGRFARRHGFDLAVVRYPRAPEHSAIETTASALEAWDLVAERYRPDRTLMFGASAGGGLAVALAMAIRDADRPEPAALVLSSPWLDVTLSQDGVDAREESDALLTVAGLRRDGEIYAGDLATTDPRVSPLFGTADALPPMQIHVGSDEILRADGEAFAAKVVAAGRTAEVVVDRGGQHCGFFLPTTEGRELRRATAAFVADRIDGVPANHRMRTLRPVDADYALTGPNHQSFRQLVRVPAPIAFNALRDPACWNEFLGIDVEWTSPEPYGVGTTRTITAPGLTADEVFLAWDDDERMTFRFDAATIPLAALAEQWAIKTVSRWTCEVVWDVAFEWAEGWPGPARRVVERAFGAGLAANVKRALPKLAGILEADPERWRPAGPSD